MNQYEILRNRIFQIEADLKATTNALQKNYSALGDAIDDIYRAEIAELKKKLELMGGE